MTQHLRRVYLALRAAKMPPRQAIDVARAHIRKVGTMRETNGELSPHQVMNLMLAFVSDFKDLLR